MAIQQSDLDAIDAQIVNPVKSQTTRFGDREVTTEQLPLEELVNRRAIASQLLDGISKKARSSFAAFRREICR